MAERFQEALRAIIDSETAAVDFLALYVAKVVSQNADGTLELAPADPRVPQHSSVPLHLGIPGSSCTIQPGGQVLLGWRDGNPAQPFAALFVDMTTIVQLNVGGSDEFVAVLSKTKAALDDLQAKFNAHTHTANNTPIVVGQRATASTDVGSTTVKVKS